MLLMQSKARTVEEYLDSLPEGRRETVAAVRDVIRKNLNKGFEEGMQYGMIGYFVPHSVYPDGYHAKPEEPLPFASIASQSRHIAVYLMCVYGNPEREEWFKRAWKESGRKLDMGKSCVRFKKLDDVALDVLGEAIKRVKAKDFIAEYENNVKPRGGKAANKKSAKKKAGRKKS